MSKLRLKTLVRQFRENGLKLLLEDPANAHDLLSLLDPDSLAGLDASQMVRDPTTYVQRDYRHIEADIVLHAPWRPPDKPRHRRRITIYILIKATRNLERLKTWLGNFATAKTLAEVGIR